MAEAAKQKFERDKRMLIRTINIDRNAVLANLEKSPSLDIVNQIASHLDAWRSNLEKLAETDEQLLDLIDPEKTLADIRKEEEAIVKDRETFSYELNKCIGKLKTMEASVKTSLSPSSPRAGRRSFLNASYLEATLTNPLVKIQDIPVPEFDGKYKNFPDWYAEFTSIVDKNENLDNFQKMYLLKRAMVGDAQIFLKDYGMDGEMYPLALEYINKSFNNRRRIIAEHFASLLDLPNIKLSSLRENLDLIQRVLRGLKVCGLNVEHLSPLVAFIVSRKLPEKLRIDWENSNHDYSSYPSFEPMYNFLSNRSFSYETSTLATSNDVGKKLAGKMMSRAGKSSTTYQSSAPEKKSFVAGSGSNKSSASPKCVVCNEFHFLNQCKVFLNKLVNDRFDIVKGNKLCLKCFNPYHTISNCKRSNCSICNGNHHSLLHRGVSNTQLNNDRSCSSVSPTDNVPTNCDVTPNTSSSGTKNAASLCALSSRKTVFLSTAVVKVQSRFGMEFGRILLDQGSEMTLITREFCNRAKLHLDKNNQPTTLVGINGTSVQLEFITKCVLKSRFSDFSVAIEAEVIDKIPYKVEKSDLSNIMNEFSFNFGESFDLPYNDVDILLGSEYVEFVLSERRHFIEGICLRESYFGFVVSGSSKKVSFFAEKASFCGLSNADLSEQFRKFINIDEVPESSKKETSLEHDLIEKHFEDTFAICEKTNRFVLRLPLKPSVLDLRGSYSKARTLLLKNERHRSAIVKKAYIDIFNEYLSLEHMSKISNIPSKSAYFIPHHMVMKARDVDISFRIVFNASCVDESGSSLNDHFLKGPVLQPTLFTNVIRFREHIVAICADIARMYRQILIHPDDRKYQQVLFRFELESPIDIYELNTLTNGIGPASYLATKCLEKISHFQRDNPVVAASLMKDFYMDNYMSGSCSFEKALELVRNVHKVLLRYGFPLCKYQSNSKNLLSQIDESLIDKRNVRSLGGEEFVMLLGLLWFNDNDTLGVNLRFDDLPTIITKRVMLSDVSKIFDILGILSPVTIRAKLIIQELWKEGRMWDEEVSSELIDEFLNFRDDLKRLSSYIIDRCYYLSSSSLLRKELVGFCDASTKAYCVVIYLRSLYSDGRVSVSFVCSKCRVAPIKPVDIHRLELMAAQLLACLIKQISDELNISEIFCFSDSQVTLSWINIDPYKLKQFVSNRVMKIVSLISKEKWFYVEGKSNPADLGTRGVSADAFLKNACWKVGPPWLSQDSEFNSYVSSPYKRDIGKVPELKDEKCVNLIGYFDNPILKILEKRSSLYKCISIVAYVRRYVGILKNRRLARKANVPIIVSQNLSFKEIEPLSVIERSDAFYCMVKIVQLHFFAAEYEALSKKVNLDKRSRLLALNVFLDSNGFIRVCGRLSKAAFSYDAKFPLIVPSNSRFIELYVEYIHVRYFHATKSFVLNAVRAKFWVVGNFLSVVKKVLRKCVLCAKLSAKFVEQFMGDLPKDRVNISKPFSTVGVDLTGAIELKCVNHRSVKFYKVYLAFFVCFCTRAIHVEIVEDLTSEAFLNALERFCARRGLPRVLYSDNATNFVGLRNVFHRSSLDKFLSEHLIEWRMIPPRSPHQGGLWEAAVKSGKSILLKAIGGQKLNFSELHTISVKIEGILNSRPLSWHKSGQFVEPLTPSHFLIGQSMTEIPGADDGSLKMKNRYFLWRRIVDSFWTSWRKDYLNQLQVRTKWKFKNRNLKIGDVVVLASKNEPIYSWPLAIVDSVCPDAEGVVRVVILRLANGALRRTTVNNVVYLPIEGVEE